MREKLPCGCVTVSPLHLKIIRFIPEGMTEGTKSVVSYWDIVYFFTDHNISTEQEISDALDDLINHKVVGDKDADRFFLTDKGIELYIAMTRGIKEE